MLIGAPDVTAPNSTVFIEGSRTGFVDLRCGIGSGRIGIGLSISITEIFTSSSCMLRT